MTKKQTSESANTAPVETPTVESTEKPDEVLPGQVQQVEAGVKPGQEAATGEVVSKADYVGLQKANQKLMTELDQLKGFVAKTDNSQILDAMGMLTRTLDAQREETVVGNINSYINKAIADRETGNDTSATASMRHANEIAERELKRQLSSMGMSLENPDLVALRDTFDSSPVDAFKHFLVLKPILARSQQPAVKITPTVPVNNSEVTPPNGEQPTQVETIGGKTYEELKAEWNKEMAAIGGQMPPVAGANSFMDSNDPETLFKGALEEQAKR